MRRPGSPKRRGRDGFKTPVSSKGFQTKLTLLLLLLGVWFWRWNCFGRLSSATKASSSSFWMSRSRQMSSATKASSSSSSKGLCVIDERGLFGGDDWGK